MLWLYHKTKPEGKIFNERDINLKEMAENGWADSPDKVGGAPKGWNMDQKYIAHRTDQATSGKVALIEDPVSRNSDRDRENERLREMLEEKDKEIEAMKEPNSLKQNADQAAEQLADERSDAMKGNPTAANKVALSQTDTKKGAGAILTKAAKAAAKLAAKNKPQDADDADGDPEKNSG